MNKPTAQEQLKTLLQNRLHILKSKGTSPRTVKEITESVLQKVGKRR